MVFPSEMRHNSTSQSVTHESLRRPDTAIVLPGASSPTNGDKCGFPLH